MIRIIISLGLIALFAFAETCDFSNESQNECEIDIQNPPRMLHKFVRDDGSEYSEYRACISAGDVELNGRQLSVLDCSMVESKDGSLTEGVSITNGNNLLKNKIITLKQNNILMRVAGDFIIDSGVRFNTKRAQNFVLEIIEGTNTKSNLVLERGASLRINALIMPEGSNSSVWMNTYYGGIYEREFIDLINQKSPEMRAEMETLLMTDDMLSLSKDGENTLSFNGKIYCGPKVNPLDLSAKDYTLKRLIKMKNDSTASPNIANAMCDVKEGGCFDNILNFRNQKIDNTNYKIATARLDIIPTYDVFIESGKIISSDGRTLSSIAPKATIEAQNFGKCETPVKVAFEQSVIDSYLASLSGADIATLALNNDKSDTKKADEVQSSDEDSPIQAEMQAELDENIQDLLAAFGMQKDAERLKKSANKASKSDKKDATNLAKDSKKDSKTIGALAQKSIDSTTDSSADSIAKQDKMTQDSTKDSTKQDVADSTKIDSVKSADSTADSSKDSIAQSQKSQETKETSETKITSDSTPQTKQEPSKETNDTSADSTKIASATESMKSTQETQQETNDASADSTADSTIDSTTSEPTLATDSTKSDEEKLKEALLAKAEPKDTKPSRTPKPIGKDEFLIVEKDAYDKLNKECYGDLKCLYESLKPYDKVVWSKKSSSEKINALYLLNVSDDNLKLDCEVRNYYGKNIKKTYNLNHTNTLAVLDMKFATSYDRTQVLCKTRHTTKATNKIIITPAKFDMKYSFADEGSNAVPTLKAGRVRLEFRESRALTLEGDVDNGFGGNLMMKNLSFTQKNKCEGITSNEVTAPNGMNLRFKKGYLQNAHADLQANTVAFGRLNIDFVIPNNDKTCIDGFSGNLEPQCTSANIAKDISIIPANFRIKTDILADKGSHQIAYYGQIDDKHTFKYNPLLSLDIEALDSDNKPIDINKTCNYGSIELSLANDKLIEFKRSSSDRLHSKIVSYLRDFEKPSGTNIETYFGISKIVDRYKNSRTITQSDVTEPTEITLTDFKFNIRFRNGTSQFDYSDVDVYDRLDEQSNPLGILFVRGKLQTNDIKGDLSTAPSLIAKYAIYCKSCDKRILAKYLQGEPEIESQFWYINTKHPSELYLSDSFIKLGKNRNNIEIKNSKSALEGRQQIEFRGKKSGIYSIAIAQRATEFAPYLNYSEQHKNTYITNSFNVLISEAEKPSAPTTSNIISNIQTSKKDSASTKATPKPTPKAIPAVTTPNAATKQGEVMLDIEE